eukprot:13227187-Heterocapsa_arctica.AAC.2
MEDHMARYGEFVHPDASSCANSSTGPSSSWDPMVRNPLVPGKVNRHYSDDKPTTGRTYTGMYPVHQDPPGHRSAWP